MLTGLNYWRKWLFLIGLGFCWWFLRRFVKSRYTITNRNNDDAIKKQLKKDKEDNTMSHFVDTNVVELISEVDVMRKCMECSEKNATLLRDHTNRMGTRTLCLVCIKRLRREKKTLYFPIKRAKKEGPVKPMTCSNCFNEVPKWRIIPTGGYLCIPCWGKIRNN